MKCLEASSWIKRLLDDLRVTAAKVCVTAAKLKLALTASVKLVLLVKIEENILSSDKDRRKDKDYLEIKITYVITHWRRSRHLRNGDGVEIRFSRTVSDCQSHTSSTRSQQSKGQAGSPASHETNAYGRVDSVATHFLVVTGVLDFVRTLVLLFDTLGVDCAALLLGVQLKHR
ncbi:hypothetical protein Tco_1304130 [Tanacetum coccineum]